MRFVVVALCIASLLAVSSCTSSPPLASAHRVANRAELIGGPRALGEVGDWMLENGRVRFIVQDAGFSRGFGVYGGALLDADLVREEGRGNSEGGTGKDNFGEMFPAFFLEALEPREVEDPNDPRAKLAAIEIENDGSDGNAAVLVVRGTGGDFIAMTQKINELLLGDSRINPTLLFETRYILEPDATYVKMTTRVQNISLPATTLRFPNAVLPGGSVVPTPFGDVVLFGAGNDVFAPHPAGYDIRFTLEDLYASNSVALPALPGITAEFLASSGKDVSYGILVEPPTAPTTNFVLANADQFPGATDHSLHVPFIASAFTGVFQVLPPPSLTPNDGAPGGTDEMEFSRYFFVGDGDVASISDQVFAKLGVPTGTLTGRVRNAAGEPVLDASIVVVDQAGAKTTQMTTDGGGRFVANVRPGTYDLVIVKEGQASERVDGVVVEAGAVTRKEIEFALPALLSVTVVEAGKGRIPAKITLVGTTPPDHVGEDTDTWLYDLSIGEHFRYSDFVPDVAADADTLRYIEHFDYTADGTLTFAARPGSYTVVVGRGLEYDRVEVPVTLKAGATATVNAELTRSVDTTGYVGADFHLHSVFSLDSNASLKDRITSYAGEGIEFAVATDHNYVVDYRATIEKAGLQRFINSAIGLELTTIDRGHFNGFPLDRGDGVVDNIEAGTIASRTYGSFEWALRDPGDIFADLRALGRKNPDGSVAD
ncbi:MAG TPA: carboxypeptidase regulatory-like domain-containing protein, partial [Myxococcota bacterium]